MENDNHIDELSGCTKNYIEVIYERPPSCECDYKFDVECTCINCISKCKKFRVCNVCILNDNMEFHKIITKYINFTNAK